MTTITKIGNSRGVRIPKAIIKQANPENPPIIPDLLHLSTSPLE